MKLYKNNEHKTIFVNDKNKIIPSSWKVDKIGKLFSLVGGGTPSTADLSYWNGEIPWLGPKEMSECNNSHISKGERFLSVKGAKSLGNKKISKGGVIISTRAPVGYVKIAENDLYTNQGCHSIQPNENILTKYTYFWFILNNSVLERNATGTTFKELSSSSFKDIDFVYPEKNEQQQIVNLLTKQELIIDKINHLKKNRLDIIDNYQQKLLSGKTRLKLSKEKEQELLDKGVISIVEEKTEKEYFSFLNINEGKFDEFVSLVDLTKDIVFYQNEEANWKSEEVNELQKQLPKDWNVEQLYKKVNFIKGKSIPENQLNYNGEGLKYLKTTEFWLDSSSKRDTVHYPGKVEEKYIKRKDEYVLGMDGFNSKIGEGTLGLVSNEDEGIVSTHFFKLEKNDIYHLVVNVLKSNYVQNFIVRLGEGTTVKMAGKYLKNLQGIFPKSTVEQKLLSMIFEKEEKLVDSLKEKIKLEEKVFKYLQQELLSGRIRIKVEE